MIPDTKQPFRADLHLRNLLPPEHLSLCVAVAGRLRPAGRPRAAVLPVAGAFLLKPNILKTGGRDMVLEPMKQFSPAYLRVQANRCQRLSRSCMDLGTARD